MLRLRKGEKHLFTDDNLLQVIHTVLLKKLRFGGLFD